MSCLKISIQLFLSRSGKIHRAENSFISFISTVTLPLHSLRHNSLSWDFSKPCWTLPVLFVIGPLFGSKVFTLQVFDEQLLNSCQPSALQVCLQTLISNIESPSSPPFSSLKAQEKPKTFSHCLHVTKLPSDFSSRSPDVAFPVVSSISLSSIRYASITSRPLCNGALSLEEYVAVVFELSSWWWFL